jgi:hypothetical protein
MEEFNRIMHRVFSKPPKKAPVEVVLREIESYADVIGFDRSSSRAAAKYLKKWLDSEAQQQTEEQELRLSAHRDGSELAYGVVTLRPGGWNVSWDGLATKPWLEELGG